MLYTERSYWMKNLTCDIFMCVTQPQITSILRFLDNHAYITTMGGGKKRSCFSILRFVVYSLHQKFYYACNVSY